MSHAGCRCPCTCGHKDNCAWCKRSQGAKPEGAHDPLRTYTIYRNPRDYPGKFVLRASSIFPGRVVPDDEPMRVADTLADARCALPRGLINSGRQPTDDPVIVETWL